MTPLEGHPVHLLLLRIPQQENLRVFFGRFLIVYFAPDSDMDGYLGFPPPETLGLSDGYF
jgi:hypothetical protein